MLVISRTRGEALTLRLPSGKWVTVKVLRVRDAVVSLGVEAPQEVVVHRGEVVARLAARAAEAHARQEDER